MSRVVIVSGLSGAGKSSILRALEDLGYEAVDNPPLLLLEELVTRSEAPLAVGVDARTRGFDAQAVLDTLARLRLNPSLRPELVYAHADAGALLRRFTETRRRHPLALLGRVLDGIAAEVSLTSKLRDAADLVLDTTELSLPSLRRAVEQRFRRDAEGAPGMLVSVQSFAFPAGLPQDADMVFDARFLRNPHYIADLRPGTGRDADVAAYIEADPHHGPFLRTLLQLLDLVLPRFVQEGKKYATIAIGCTGGRHRSVLLAEQVGAHLSGLAAEHGWHVAVSHRELMAQAARGSERPVQDASAMVSSGRVPAQAQEA